MPGTHFDLVGHWRIAAPVDCVWAELADPAGWPRWWPCVRAVQTLRCADACGAGGVCRIHWSTRLAHDVVVDLEALEVLRHKRLRGRARGAMAGEGIWLLRGEGAVTEVTSVWRVQAARSWLRWLAPLLRWNHAGVMQAGELGLRQHLAATTTARRR